MDGLRLAAAGELRRIGALDGACACFVGAGAVDVEYILLQIYRCVNIYISIHIAVLLLVIEIIIDNVIKIYYNNIV